MTDKELLDEVIALTSRPVVRPDDITTKSYMRDTGVSHSTATRRLDELVDQGGLERDVAWDPELRRDVNVWRKPKEA